MSEESFEPITPEERFKVVLPDNGLSEEQRTWWCINCNENTVHQIGVFYPFGETVWRCEACSSYATNRHFEDGEDLKIFWKEFAETQVIKADLEHLPRKILRGEKYKEISRVGMNKWIEVGHRITRFHRWHRMDNGTMCHMWKLWFHKPNWAIRIHWHRWKLLFYPVSIKLQRREPEEFYDLDSSATLFYSE
jgi:hypothetical protein